MHARAGHAWLLAAAAVVAARPAPPARPDVPPRIGGGAESQVWRPASFAVGGSSPVRVATVNAGGTVAYVAWIDHTRTTLALYPGTLEPPTASPRGLGEVPSGQRWRLLATFNGGFKANAGAGGFLVNGVADEPLLDGMGTVVAHPNGRVDIVSWHGPRTRRNLELARQNLPLLVDGGRPSPNVANVSAWGLTLGGGAAVWRSALGIDAQGDLLYVAADAQTPASLAQLLIRVGARRAIQLDINPEWPSFIAYRHRGGRDPLKVVPNPQEGIDRWLVADTRDFFAVYTRAGGGPSVPFR